MKSLKNLFNKKKKDSVKFTDSYLHTGEITLTIFHTAKLRIEFKGVFKVREHEYIPFHLIASSEMSVMQTELLISHIATKGVNFPLSDIHALIQEITANYGKIIHYSRRQMGLGI